MSCRFALSDLAPSVTRIVRADVHTEAVRNGFPDEVAFVVRIARSSLCARSSAPFLEGVQAACRAGAYIADAHADDGLSGCAAMYSFVFWRRPRKIIRTRLSKFALTFISFILSGDTDLQKLQEVYHKTACMPIVSAHRRFVFSCYRTCSSIAFAAPPSKTPKWSSRNASRRSVRKSCFSKTRQRSSIVFTTGPPTVSS